jgi:uncharacterized membrane protein
MASFHVHPPSRHKLKEQRKVVPNANVAHEEQLSRLERLALAITERIGTMGFFFVILTWTTLWLTWNFLAPQRLKFDPPMAFVFWLFISNMIQIFLMPLIMIGQNLQSRHADIRAENDYEVNVRAEREVMAVLHHLEYQNAMLLALVKKMGVDEVEALKLAKEHFNGDAHEEASPPPS